MNIELEKQKQQFENLSNKTQYIIDASIVDSKTESIYNSIKEEWLLLKNTFDNWQDISFTNADIYTVPEYYRKFSDDCKLKMQRIQTICNEQLSILYITIIFMFLYFL